MFKFRITVYLLFIVFCAGMVQNVFAYPSVYPKGVTIDEPSKTYDGYTTIKLTAFDEEGKATGEDIIMLDMEGNVVHKWEDVGFTLHYNFLDNGNMVLGVFLRQCPGGGCPIDGKKPPISGIIGSIVERDWDNNIVWTYENDGDFIEGVLVNKQPWNILQQEVSGSYQANALDGAWPHIAFIFIASSLSGN